MFDFLVAQINYLFFVIVVAAVCCYSFNMLFSTQSFGYDIDEAVHGPIGDAGYKKGDRVVKMFWSVFHNDLTEDDKRDFLSKSNLHC